MPRLFRGPPGLEVVAIGDLETAPRLAHGPVGIYAVPYLEPAASVVDQNRRAPVRAGAWSPAR